MTPGILQKIVKGNDMSGEDRPHIKGAIFDMDGCLYAFAGGAPSFSRSPFGERVRQNITKFFQEQLGYAPDRSLEAYRTFQRKYDGEVSLGVEKEHGIPRARYFATTWDLQPSEFITHDPRLSQVIGNLSIRRGVLSSAPKIWVDRTLKHLGVDRDFDPIYTGELRIRKPQPAAFRQFMKAWKLQAAQIIAIGDQEETDILPAQSIGMRTMRIGRDVKTKADFAAHDIMSGLQLLQEEGILA